MNEVIVILLIMVKKRGTGTDEKSYKISSADMTYYLKNIMK
jgi:hypothetical protein